jgi:ribosomal protein L3
VKGAIPGSTGSVVIISEAVKKTVKKAKNK